MRVLGIATAADLLRLLILPGFAWAAYRDILTRRVTHKLWRPLLAIGVAALLIEAAGKYPFTGYSGRIFLVQVGFSIFFLIPFSILANRMSAFGGADAKALIVLAVAFPTTPQYVVPLWILPDVTWLHAIGFPVHPSALGVAAMSALTNAVLFGAAYVLTLFGSNLLRGRFSPAMLVGKWTPVSSLPTVHGQLIRVEGVRLQRGLDLDALRMYLRWRGTTLAAVRENPDAFRDPESVGETNPPTDGAVHDGPRTDGGRDETLEDPDDGFEFPEAGVADDDATAGDEADAPADDPWAAEQFLDDIERTAYGTTPETLREGLERATSEDAVWVSPGLPFLVPLFGGLLLALTYGDALTVALGALGLV